MGNHNRLQTIYGYPSAYPSTGTMALSGTKASGYAPNWLAVSIYARESKTLSKIKIYASAVTGTLAVGDLVCNLYSDTGSGTPNPNTSLDASTGVTSLPTGAAWVEFTGFTYSLTAGTLYWLVFRNIDSATSNGSAIANYPTYKIAGTTSVLYSNVSQGGAGLLSVRTTTNSGSTWSQTNNTGLVRLEYSDGGATYDGLPFYAATIGGSAYGTTETGIKLTIPSNGSLVLRGISIPVNKGGTPTGLVTAKVYLGNSTTIVTNGESLSIPAHVFIAASAWGSLVQFYFSNPITLTAGSTYRITIKNSASDSVSNYYTIGEWTVENDANSKSLVPWMRTVLSGGSWTDTDTGFPPIALLLDRDGEFASAGGGNIIVVED